MRVTVVATLGHTFTHPSYVLADAGAGGPIAVFSSIAASFLAAAGRRLTAIDDVFGNAREAGLPLTGPGAP